MQDSYSYNSDTLLKATCYDTTDLFQIIIHSYSELSSRENDGEEDAPPRDNQVDLVNTKCR